MVPAVEAGDTPPGNVRFEMFVCVVNGRVLQRDRSRHALAELRGIGNLVHTGDVVAAARKRIGTASRIALPRCVEDRNRATKREPCELD